MTKKNKIILLCITSLTIAITVYFYTVWSANKEKKKVVEWVESHGGTVEFGYPEWVESSPGFMREIAKKVAGEDIIYIKMGQDIEVIDFTPLKSLKQIGLLNLSSTSINDFSLLKDLTHLEELGVHYSQLSNMSSLKYLSQLKVLYIKIRGISVAEVTGRLRKKVNEILPKCEIIFSAG